MCLAIPRAITLLIASSKTWIVIIASMTIALCVFSMAVVLSKQSGRKDQERFLALFLALYGLVKFDQLYIHTAGYVVWPHFLGIAFALKLFLPSIMYFYTRSLTFPKAQWLSKKDGLALLAPGIAALVALPYYILTADQKIALMSPLTRDPVLYERAILGCQIGLFLFVCTAFGYLVMSFKRFREHSSRLQMLFSRIDDKQIDWLRWVILILSFGWTWYALSELWLLTGKQPRSVYLVNMIVEMFFVGFIAFRGINQSPVYVSSEMSEALASTDLAEEKEPLYSKSGLTEEAKESIALKLNQVMEQEALHKDSELSLRILADKIEVSEVRISETFSQHMRTNFFDFVNAFRVNEACRLLAETNDKILSVAYDSGFNSRSTFGAAFKKHAQMSPSQYRTLHKKTD